MSGERGRPYSRRDFLRWAGASLAVPAVGISAWEAWRNLQGGPGRAGHEGAGSSSGTGKGARGPALLTSGAGGVTAAWVQHENSLPGTASWCIYGNAVPSTLDGYADRVSASRGERVTLYVSCDTASFYVEAFRMGWYGGLGGRLLWRSPSFPGRVQSAPVLTAGINMVECHWAPSASFTVGRHWPPGDYLLKLTATGGQQRYVPLVVRDDASRSAFVVQNSVTTWQAYNTWGGYSQYFGPGHSFSTRSRVVSFDRPYESQWAYGAADFVGNELPLVMLVERLGLDVTYWTDVDLHQRPELLGNHRCLVSLGHDEYWSPAMFYGCVTARSRGTNLVFLGANACFRRIRLAASPLGPDRRQICYKVPTEDPLYGHDNSIVTANWPDPPDARPESLLIGNMYQSYGVHGDLVVADPAHWTLRGTGMARGDRLPGVVGPEFDGYDPAVAGPRNLDVVCHSPVVAQGSPGFSDMTWYSDPTSGAGVFASGTNRWVNGLAHNNGAMNPGLVHPPVPVVTSALTTVTHTLLSACGSGPAGRSNPSRATWRQFYPPVPTPSVASNYRTYWGA